MSARRQVGSGAPWEAAFGYSRAVRVGPHVYVTGTVGILPDGAAAGSDAATQARRAFVIIGEALAALGAALDDVVQTRMYVVDIQRDGNAVGRVHGEVFGAIRPTTTMVEVRALIRPDLLVEIEAEAYVAAGAAPPP
jgi:enamine deaminase RidA (YjgF/YER057c/UK114 family)